MLPGSVQGDAEKPAADTHRGLSSLITLCSFLGVGVTDTQQLQMDAKYPGLALPLTTLRSAAQDLGIRTLAASVTLDEIHALNRPCLVALQEPERVVVVLDVLGDAVQIACEHGVSVHERASLGQQARFASLVPQAPQGGHPRAVVSGSHRFFGEISVNAEVAHAFEVRNEGSAALALAVVPPSCGTCVSGSVSPASVPPGGRATVRASFRARQFGPVVASLKLRTNDPLRAVVALAVSASVTKGLLLDPPSLTVRLDRATSKTANVRVHLPVGCQILSVTSTLPFVSGSAERVGEDNTRSVWISRITVNASATPGVFEGSIAIARSLPGAPPITVPIRVSVIPGIQVAPRELFFGSLKIREPMERELRITSRNGKAFGVTGIVVPHPWLSVGKPEPVGGGFRVKVVAEGQAQGMVEGTITVRTNVPGEESIEIPVTGWVK